MSFSDFKRKDLDKLKGLYPHVCLPYETKMNLATSKLLLSTSPSADLLRAQNLKDNNKVYLSSPFTIFSLYFFPHTFNFQLLDKPWSQVSSLFSPGSCPKFLSPITFSNPTARRHFIECC